ncbi:MAG: TatD family hydrolase [Bacteroidia bacterium]|nr:TatD family hydrolase [Bacteroidia bacterium]
MLIDIHSHNYLPKPSYNRVLSLQLHPNSEVAGGLHSMPSEVIVSAGVHPWHASEWSSENISRLNVLLQYSQIAFIGEIGLDNACDVPLEKQLLVFEYQLMIANTSCKSVLIHNVGHQTELLALKKRYKRIPIWILHGFRGKAQLAEQYIRKDFYLSFGSNYQVEALRACPIDRLFIETDDSDVDLRTLYQKVAENLGVSEERLETSISRNFGNLGIK